MSEIEARQPVIAMERLTKFYGNTRGIEDVTLEIVSGEVFGFLGPNGAGKSTCIRSMLGLINPTSGNVTLLGQRGVATRGARQRIGYLPEAVSFYDELTAGAQLDFLGRFFRENRRAARRRSELLERFAVNPDVTIRNCSKGTLQKVGIVQAFMHEPELLVLDEPTSGLDPLMQEEFYRLVEEENGRGRTVFLSSHNLAEVERVCSRVGMIRDGRLIAVQDIESLKRQRPKKVEVTLRQAEEAVASLPRDARSISVGKEKLSFLFGGRPRALVEWLRSVEIVDFNCYDPPLQELFIAYYDKGKPC